MDITLHKLDKILKELVKIRAILEVNIIMPLPHYPVYPQPCYPPYPFEPYITYYTDAPDSTTNIDPICNCHEHKSGEGTGGWYCPIHGQIF